MRKNEFLNYWKGLQAQQAVEPQPIAYKHEGSTYDEDSIRLTGSRRFIDSVLSRLHDLLEYENSTTRLQVVYKETVDRQTKEIIPDAFNCYVQVHERGYQAQMLNSYMATLQRNHNS